MMEVSYENHLGTVVNLNDGNYYTNANDLRDYEWSFDILSNPSGIGGKIQQFSRTSAKKKLRVAVRGSQELFLSRMNALQALTEPDIIAKMPGKLWVNGQYLPCYIYASTLALYSRKGNFAEKEWSILATKPFWHTETTLRFSPDVGTIEGGKRYPLRFPYRYGTGYSNQTLYNLHYAETPIKLVIFGPVSDPSITIAGHTYSVTAELLENERIEVDQIYHTIVKIDASGTQYNLFNARDKENDIFQAVPAGSSKVVFANMTFEITMIQRRSEPKWK